jgi:beta-lactamase regulating signal transducer with metallopeptidase domain
VKFMTELLIAIFAAVPTVLLIGDYMQRRSINFWLVVLWLVCTVCAIAFAYGTSLVKAVKNDEHPGSR